MRAGDAVLAMVIVVFLLVLAGVIGGLGLLALDMQRCDEVAAEMGVKTTYTIFDRCTVDIFGFRVPV